ncbi:hypothetical protein GGF31_002663 [Allomyces arbusculus]|nr:hypothetical protein GGF31_002663 [Allomyces arbusculus]
MTAPAAVAVTAAVPVATTVDSVATAPPTTSTTTTTREPWQTQDYLLLLAAVQRSGGLPVRNWHYVQQLLHSCPLASTRLRAAGPKTLEWHYQQFMHDQQPFATPLSLEVALQVLYAKRFRELYNSIQSEDDVLREELRKLYPPPSTPGSSTTPASSSTPVPEAVPDSVHPPLPIVSPTRDAPLAGRRGSMGPALSPTRIAGADPAAPVSAADQLADGSAPRAEDRAADADVHMTVDSPPPSTDAVDEPMDVDTAPVTDFSSTTTAAAPAPALAITSPAPPSTDGASTSPAGPASDAATSTSTPPSTAATDAPPGPATHPLTQVMAMDVDTDPNTTPSSEHSSELAIALPDSDAHAIALPDPTPTSPSAFPPWAGARRGSRESVTSEPGATAASGEGTVEEEDANDETSEVISLDVEFSDTTSDPQGGGAAAPTEVKDEDVEDAEEAVIAAAARALRETTAGSDVTMGEATSSSEPVSRTASVDATTSAAQVPTAALATAPARRGRRASLRQGDDKYKAWRRLCLHKWDDIASLRLGNTFQSHGGRRDTDLGETYRAVIKQPMDLKTIRQRVRDGSVHATDEFHRDLLLMLANTCMYYPPGSDWHAMALEMKGEVEVQMAQFRSVEAAAAARVTGVAHGGSPALSAAGAGAATPDARPVLGRRDVSPSPLPEPMVVSASGVDGDEAETEVAVKTEMG